MSIKESLRTYLTGQKWTLGFIEESIDNVVKGEIINIHYLKGQPTDRWFADPFILDINSETITLLVEEYLYSTRLGRIAKLTIKKKDYCLIRNETILELDSHLSFPAILRDSDRIYIYPENAHGKGLALYEYSSKTGKCSYVKTITDLPLADAIITNLFGENLLFSTQIPTHNGKVLTIYRMSQDHPQKIKECVFPSNTARNAGDWFKVGGDIYRPAQDCNEGYGMAVILQKVYKQSDNFVFEDKVRIVSSHPLFTTGCHTFNYYNGLAVIDVHGYINPRVAKLYSKIRKYI